MNAKLSQFFKLTLALLLFLQLGEVSAQTKIEYTSGANTPFEGGTMTVNAPNKQSGACYQLIDMDGYYSWLFYSYQYAQVNFTNPTTRVVVEFFGADGDEIHLDVNGANYAITPSMMSCGFVNCSTSCGTPTYPNGNLNNAGPGAYRLTITGTLINNFRITLNYGNGFPLSNFTFTPCGGGAPTLSATTINNNSSCTSPYINVNSLITSTAPTDTTLKWFTSPARTTEVTDPTTVSTSGTYFAFYYDGTNNCFSPASAGVTATVNNCCATIAPPKIN